MDSNKERLCRICISSYGNCTQLISIFGEDSLWKKITTFADVKIERHDSLPQHVCITCAKNTISACLFKKKCEDADNFFRQQLLIQKIEGKSDIATISRHQLFENEEFGAYANGLKSEDDVKNQMPLMGDNDVKNVPITYSSHMNGKHYEEEVTIDNENNNNDSPKRDCSIVQSNESFDDDGEIRISNKGKLPFDFESIRRMHEYVQQQLSKFSEIQNIRSDVNNKNNREEEGTVNVNASENDDDDPLPIIPEIEIVTPSDESEGGVQCSNIGNYMNVDVHMKSYQCPHCFQIFEMKHTLKTHMQTVHNASVPVYECSHCKKTYFYKRFLEKHIRRGRCVKKRRNQTKPMQCTDCCVLFPTGHHLGWHKRTGCPSKIAKMPLQQLFKQNIVQYNNFPKRIGVRKPENAIYLHNRKLIMANTKRKGRTRIKLDAKKIALAKQLILRDATTTVIANELNISRTFAWRLRKNLVNGISLHERVIDPVEDEDNTIRNSSKCAPAATIISTDKQTYTQENLTEFIKTEIEAADVENSKEESAYFQQNVSTLRTEHSQSYQQNVAPPSVIQRNEQMDHMHKLFKSSKIHNHSHQQQSLQQFYQSVSQRATSDIQPSDEIERNKSQLGKLTDENIQPTAYQQQYRKNTTLCSQDTNSGYDNVQSDKIALPIEPQFSTSITAPITNLPVNLSVRPIPALQNSEKIRPALIVSAIKKKPRKPNVFIDDEKYALAKLMMTQSASTMEIAKALNVSQMTAWKVRDAIIKGVPLTYRGKRLQLPNGIGSLDETKVTSIYRNRDIKPVSDIHKQKNLITNNQQKPLIYESNLQSNNMQNQREIHVQHLPTSSQPQLQEILQIECVENQQQQEQHEIMPQTQEIMVQTHLNKLELAEKTAHVNSQNSQKLINNKKRCLKAAEREVRDKEVTSEILELIKADNNIQYWKVSARLAEKGYAISPSSVCQKLKSMGFHRRWKPGDKTTLIGMKRLKTTNSNDNNILDNTATTQIISNSANSFYKNHIEQQKYEIGEIRL